jgi:hypothetical protein
MTARDIERVAAERAVGGDAWRDFCDTLRAAGDIIIRESTDELERAEGFRYLTRLTRNSLERFVENSEPYRPRLRDTPWRCTVAIQSPDQDHPLIEIDGNLEYRIRGRRNTISYASFLALASSIPADVGARSAVPIPEDELDRFDPTNYRPTGFLSIHDLDINPDGTFEIILSTRRHPGNWLRLEPDSTFIMIRQTYLDRASEKPMDLTVERVDPEPVRPIRPDELARHLAIAAQNVVGTTSRFLHWAHELAKAPNTLTRIDDAYRNSGGSPDHLMYFGYWELEPDQALVITARLPGNDYWNFQACNWWLENLDNYEDGAGYLTKRTAKSEPDGSIMLVLAHVPPGRGNWIDVFGHRRGTMNLRLVHADGDADVTVEKVPLAAVTAR